LLQTWRGKVAAAEDKHFTILIADLDGDEDGRQTRHVRAALLAKPGLEVQLPGRLLEVADLGSQTAAQLAVERHGRKLLEAHNGDLLIWGEVRAADKELNLWFLHRAGASTLGAPSYSLTEKLSLPEDFNQELGAQLEALALASLSPATEQRGRYLVDLLKEPAEKLERLLEKGAPGLDRNQVAGLQLALGRAAVAIGEQSGDKNWLTKAVDANRQALQALAIERVPREWARAQNNLGAALTLIGQHESQTARLEEALDAYRNALQEWTRERVPLQWATVQNNLGTALLTLGEREFGTARLEEAITAYRNALQELTRERVPLDWAMTQGNLGNALWRLTEPRSRGTRASACPWTGQRPRTAWVLPLRGWVSSRRAPRGWRRP
jgi:tetratricopeptide (TPR) repeat protein